MTKEAIDIIKEIELKIAREVDAYWKGDEKSVYLTPKLTDDYRTILASWFERYSEELVVIEQTYPAEWLAIRKESDSVKEADMKYDQTDKGQRRMSLRAKLKSIPKMISALRDRLKRMSDESYLRY